MPKKYNEMDEGPNRKRPRIVARGKQRSKHAETPSSSSSSSEIFAVERDRIELQIKNSNLENFAIKDEFEETSEDINTEHLMNLQQPETILIKHECNTEGFPQLYVEPESIIVKPELHISNDEDDESSVNDDFSDETNSYLAMPSVSAEIILSEHVQFSLEELGLHMENDDLAAVSDDPSYSLHTTTDKDSEALMRNFDYRDSAETTISNNSLVDLETDKISTDLVNPSEINVQLTRVVDKKRRNMLVVPTILQQSITDARKITVSISSLEPVAKERMMIIEKQTNKLCLHGTSHLLPGNLEQFFNKLTESIDMKNRPLQCYRCSENTIAYDEYKNHFTCIHHDSEPDKALVAYENYLKDTTLVSKLPCYLCKTDFINIHNLLKHMPLEHNLCRVCGLKLEGPKGSKHMISHETCFQYIVRCDLCTNEFPSKVVFINHCRTEHTEHTEPPCTVFQRIRGLDCPYCMFSTDEMKILLYHIQLHQPKPCELCKRLYVPCAKHISDASFRKCEKCEPLYFLKLNSHSNFFRDLPCPNCSKILLDGVKLYTHTIQDHKFCVHCSSHFENSEEFTKHQQTFHRQIFKCSACLSKFKNVSLHFKIKHSDIKYKYSVVSSLDLNVERVLSNSQCCYCLKTINPAGFERHLVEMHQVIRCTKCTGFMFKSKRCRKCPFHKARCYNKNI